MILLHGIAGSLHHWDFLLPALAAAGFRALAPDLLGHGDSPKPEVAEAYHVESLYTHLTWWIDSLHLRQPPLLIGHSMGGYLSLQYTLRNPGKVLGLVLVNPFYRADQLMGLVRFSIQRPHLSTSLLRVAPQATIYALMRLDLKAQKRLPPATRRQLALDFKRADPRVITIAHTAEDLSPQLDRLRLPTLVVWGKEDLTLSPQTFPELVRSLPVAWGMPVEKAGHIPHLTHRQLVNPQVLDFLCHLPAT